MPTVCSGGSRISHTAQVEGGTPDGGGPTYYLIKYMPKPFENERNQTETLCLF